jgi:urease accessory protein
VPVQVGAGWLAYEHDHVLDDMIEELGLAIETHIAPFEPEAGGYRHGGHHAEAHHHEH